MLLDVHMSDTILCCDASLLVYTGGTTLSTSAQLEAHDCTVNMQDQYEGASATLELPVVLSMTRLKAFRIPKGCSFSFTCRQRQHM